jgi:hypothetical protein
LLGIVRTVRRKACTFGIATYVPALIHGCDIDSVPDRSIFVLVVGIQVVDVKTTDVLPDFLDTVVTPVVVLITYVVVVRTHVAPVITVLIEGLVVTLICISQIANVEPSVEFGNLSNQICHVNLSPI